VNARLTSVRLRGRLTEHELFSAVTSHLKARFCVVILSLQLAGDIAALRTALDAVASRVRWHEEQIRQLNRMPHKA
jgi:hypothetical protein